MDVATSPPRKAKKPSENRDKLIAVSHEPMARRGFAETSTEEIVRSARFTRGALYYQFVDKRDLFRSVCEALPIAIGSALDPEHARRVYRESLEMLLDGLSRA